MTVQAQWKSMMQTGYEIENNKNYILQQQQLRLLRTGQAPEINQIAAPAKGRQITAERESAKEREGESESNRNVEKKLNSTKNQQ